MNTIHIVLSEGLPLAQIGRLLGQLKSDIGKCHPNVEVVIWNNKREFERAATKVQVIPESVPSVKHA